MSLRQNQLLAEYIRVSKEIYDDEGYHGCSSSHPRYHELSAIFAAMNAPDPIKKEEN